MPKSYTFQRWQRNQGGEVCVNCRQCSAIPNSVITKEGQAELGL